MCLFLDPNELKPQFSILHEDITCLTSRFSIIEETLQLFLLHCSPERRHRAAEINKVTVFSLILCPSGSHYGDMKWNYFEIKSDFQTHIKVFPLRWPGTVVKETFRSFVLSWVNLEITYSGAENLISSCGL